MDDLFHIEYSTILLYCDTCKKCFVNRIFFYEIIIVSGTTDVSNNPDCPTQLFHTTTERGLKYGMFQS